MNTMDTSRISCVKISGVTSVLTHHTLISIPLEPEAFSTEKKTTRCLKTLAAMRDRGIISGNIFHVLNVLLNDWLLPSMSIIA